MCFTSFSQPIRVTFDEFPQREFKNPSFTKSANLRTEATALTLPFWEDFSDTANLGNHFKPNTGIYFNNHLCLNQPSINVATFDGLDGKGKKYDPNYIFQKDKADSLVSLDFDISGISAKDSLYFSFQYQIAGFGEIPDQSEGDSLILQFFTKGGKWKSVWRSDFKTATDTSKFYPILFKVTDSVYFHPNFKFKFFNYARLSGMFDLWHVDYIVMDTIKAPNNNREIKDGRLYFSDIAISKSPSSIFAPYQSIPVNHLSGIPFKNSFDLSLSSLSQNFYRDVQHSYSFEAKSSSQSVSDPIKSNSTPILNPGILPIKQPFTSSLTPFTEEFVIQTKVFLNLLQTPESNYQFQKNDMAVSVFPFRNYYAYDDGEYEYGVRFDQVNAIQAVAYDFVGSERDTLTHIDMCIPPIGYNIQGVRFQLKIWEDNNGKPGKELYSQLDTVKYYPDIKSASYSNGLNPFTRYTISTKKTIKVSGRFYVGFKQLSGNSKAIRLGFDSNNNNKDKFWYDNNQGNGWSQFRNLNGSMMIRPVFSNGIKRTNARIGEGENRLEMYPNPNNTDILTLNDTFENVRIYDQTGRLRLNYDSVEKIDISNLEVGYFFVKAIINGTVHTLQLIRAQK